MVNQSCTPCSYPYFTDYIFSTICLACNCSFSLQPVRSENVSIVSFRKTLNISNAKLSSGLPNKFLSLKFRGFVSYFILFSELGILHYKQLLFSCNTTWHFPYYLLCRSDNALLLFWMAPCMFFHSHLHQDLRQSSIRIFMNTTELSWGQFENTETSNFFVSSIVHSFTISWCSDNSFVMFSEAFTIFQVITEKLNSLSRASQNP